MSVVGIILGINIYVLFLILFHKMFSDKHGDAKAFIFGNALVLAGLMLIFVLFY